MGSNRTEIAYIVGNYNREIPMNQCCWTSDEITTVRENDDSNRYWLNNLSKEIDGFWTTRRKKWWMNIPWNSRATLMHLPGESFMKVNRSLTENYWRGEGEKERGSGLATNSCFRNKSVVNMRKHYTFSSTVIKWASLL